MPLPNPSIASLKFGNEDINVLVVDDFHPAPETIIEYAEDELFIESGPTYPGIRGPGPDGYHQIIQSVLAATVDKMFQGALSARAELSALSLVTKSPDSLSPLQKIPHFDGPQKERLAFVHYLCSETYGGTSFYRHRATGYEAVTQARLNSYESVIAEELMELKNHQAAYPSQHTPFFEKIGSVECRYNRLVMYRGCALHSGDVPDPSQLSENVRTGRLTVTGFLKLLDHNDTYETDLCSEKK